MLSWQTSYFVVYTFAHTTKIVSFREFNNSLLTVICISISRSTMQYNNYIIHGISQSVIVDRYEN